MNKQIKINHLIFEKIKFRYEFLSARFVNDRTRRNKLLLDSFYPYNLAMKIVNNGHQMHNHLTEGTGYAISERVAEDMNCRILHISELTSMLGYTKTDISKLLQSVKNKEYNIALVGAGGTGSNFMHWLYQMCEWTGKEQIFSKLYIADDDEYDIPNMLRVPFIPEYGRANGGDTSKKIDLLPKKFEVIAKNNTREAIKFEAASDAGPGTLVNARLGHRERTVVYGAPDIETRGWLTASNWTFIAATHRDNEFSLVENPAVDNDLMMETYGKITLSKFFLNHLTMTIKFLQNLSDRTEVFGTTEERVLLRENFNELYETELSSGFKAGSKKLFAVGTESLMAVELDLPEGT